MNKLPKVKDFINEEATKYSGLTIDYVGGDPRIQFYDEAGEELDEAIDISKMDGEEIHVILMTRGIIHSLEEIEM